MRLYLLMAVCLVGTLQIVAHVVDIAAPVMIWGLS